MAKKTKDKKPKLIDGGTVAGSIAASAILALWLFVEFSSSSSAKPLPDPDSSPSVTHGPGPETESPKTIDPAPEPEKKSWEDDARWEENLSLGNEGIQQAKDAVRWKEEKGGDPFYFASQIHEAGEKVIRAIRGMEALKKDFADNPEATASIDKWLKYFKKQQPRRSK
jgi:hypothetical protein